MLNCSLASRFSKPAIPVRTRFSGQSEEQSSRSLAEDNAWEFFPTGSVANPQEARELYIRFSTEKPLTAKDKATLRAYWSQISPNPLPNL